jgi:hypothetical protein
MGTFPFHLFCAATRHPKNIAVCSANSTIARGRARSHSKAPK